MDKARKPMIMFIRHGERADFAGEDHLVKIKHDAPLTSTGVK